ncbi:MAG: O-antigen ligase family protein [Kiritimatiellaeota bacterium]|nr:O-antigen ligase family protein [Kiritimatiellota bacterium]
MDLELRPEAIWARRLLLTAVAVVTFSVALGQLMLVLACVPLTIWLVRARPVLPALLIPALLFIAIAWLTLAFNTAKPDFSRMTKLLWFVALPAAAWLLRDERSVRHLLWAFAFGCGALAIKTLVMVPVGAWKLLRKVPEYAQNFPHALTLQGSMPDGQMLMLGLVATLGLLLICRAARQPTCLVIALFLLQIVGFILNQKRGSWIVAILLLVIFVLMKLTWKHTLLIALVVAGALCLPWVRERLTTLERDFNPDVGGRATMWLRVAPALIKAHPWGIGYRTRSRPFAQQRAHRAGGDRLGGPRGLCVLDGLGAGGRDPPAPTRAGGIGSRGDCRAGAALDVRRPVAQRCGGVQLRYLAADDRRRRHHGRGRTAARGNDRVMA